MFTKSYLSLLRLAGNVLTLLLAATSLCRPATAQAPVSVVSSSPVALSHTGPYGSLWQSAMSNRGDFVVIDFSKGAIYQFPANGGPVITVAAPGKITADSGITIDSRNNNLYADNNFNGGLLEFPYDAATGTWDLGSQAVAGGLSGNIGGTCGTYFQSAGLAMTANGLMAIATENSCGTEIFTVPVDSSGNFGAPVAVVSGLQSRARDVAIDNTGNIYFDEDGGTPGAFFIPAGSTGLSGEGGLARIDPSLTAITGVTVDTAGDVYVSDQNAGVFLVPLESGVPNPADAVLLTPAPAQGNASLDQARGILYIPTSGWQGFQDVVKLYLGDVDLGTSAVGAPSAAATIYYSFSSSTTPASFVIDEAGVSATDFAVGTGGTCAAGTAYAALGSCTLSVTMNPHSVGGVAAKLLMLDANGNILATTLLHGVGQGSSALVTPATESAIGNGFVTPSEVAVDASANSYVADAGLGKVLMYPKGSGVSAAPVSVGTGLTAPTGVAVDGGGDVFIADSGNVLEVPYGPTGLNAAAQMTLKSGLGTNLRLAVDGVGNLYVADPDNHRVVDLSSHGGTLGVIGQNETDLTGFTAPSAIAVDGSNNLYVADEAKLIEVAFPTDAQTTLLSSLSGANGIAIDPSGAVYVAQAGGTIRIPSVGGTLNPAAQTLVATSVLSPASVAVDATSNVYIADGTAENVHFVSPQGFFNFGALSSTSATQSTNVTIQNNGNAPLNISGFTGTADFSETATTCSGPVAVNSTCSLTLTFNPGPGDQGSLTGQVGVTSDAVNSPVGVNVVGVGATLANSTTALSVGATTVNGAQVTVTVGSASGTGATPTGNVSLTINGNGITPIVITQPLTAATIQFDPMQIPAGSYTFTTSYGGDRTYGTSTASATVSVAPGAVTLVQPTMGQVQQANPTYPYVLAGQSGSYQPTDGSVSQFEYTYPVQVVATDGAPLIGLPVYNNTGTQVGMNYGSVTFQGAGVSCAAVPVAADGTAPFSTACLSIDTSNSSIPDILTAYTITPVYSPAGASTSVSVGTTNPNYAPATGAAISFTALRNPMVQISSNPSTLSITPGSTTTATLTLSSILGYGVAGAGAPLYNYSLPVQLACDGLPAYASCSFSYSTPDPTDPNSVDVGPTPGTVLSYMGGTAAPCTVAQGCVGPGTVIMTINTNGSTGAVSVSSLKRAPSGVEFAVMFGVGLFGFAFGKKRSLRGRLLTLVCLVLCGGIMAGASGCSTKQLGTTSGTPTPAGTYTVMVTAKQVGSQTVTVNGAPTVVYGNSNQMSLPFTINLTVN